MSHQHFRSKTVRCRYFDDTGRPVKPHCNQGEFCSFAHPDDPQWSVALSVAKKFLKTPDAPRAKDNTNSHSPPLPRRFPPLTPQSALFKRSVPDKDTLFDSEDPASYTPRSYENRSYLGVEKPDHRYPEKSDRAPRVYDDRIRIKQEDSSRVSSRQPRARDMFATTSSAELATNEMNNPESDLNVARAVTDYGLPEAKKNAEKIVTTFRQLAKTSDKLIQDTVSMARESQKLETYTELSSTLAKVSPSAAASVTPSLTTIVQNHALYKGQVEDDLNELTHIWEDMFQVFIRGVGNVLDMGLEDALRILRKEREKISADLQIRDKDKKKRDGDEDCDRNRKRRRVELEDGQVSEKYRFPSRSDSRLGDMYDEMRSKLDRQAQRLNQLTTENLELKSVLQGPRRASNDSNSNIKENMGDNWSDRGLDDSVESGTSLWERIDNRSR